MRKLVIGRPVPFSAARLKQYAEELWWAVIDLRDETEIVRRYGVRYYTNGIDMSISGIQPGVFEAKMAQLQKKLADRINGGLAKIDVAAETGASKMDAAVNDIIAKVDKEIADKLQEFAQVTNGAPASTDEHATPGPYPTYP